MARVRNYINNKSLYEELIEHKKKFTEAEKLGILKPQVSNYIGESILLICNNLGKKLNFSGYTYKQDMISDGIIDCIAAVDNFDPDKTNNPFAYFTQIAWNAFIRRIQKEKKQTYIKHKNFQSMYTLEEQWVDNQLKTNEFSDDIINNFENTLAKKKIAPKPIGVEKFVEGIK